MKILVLCFFCFGSLNLQAKLVERVQAQIGTEMISLMDFKSFQKQLQVNLVPQSLLLTTLSNRSQLLKDKNKLLNFMIARETLRQLVQNKTLKIPQTAIDKVLRTLKGSSSHRQFAGKLKKAKLTLKTLKQDLLLSLKIDLFIKQSVISKITVSEQDIESYHFNNYHSPLFKKFEYEFVAINFPESKKSEVLKKFLEGSPTSLEKVASSLALEFKLSKLKQEDIHPALKKELDKLSVSQISPVILIGTSYYILQLKWKSPHISRKEQRKKLFIEKILYKEKLKQELKKWIEEEQRAFSILRHSL